MAARQDPRANQKQRTRAAIVDAATRLLQGGVEPTVAGAAAAAKVSRATAYRYFPTPESLLMEVAGVTPAYASVEALVQSLEGEDVEARLAQFVERFNAVSFAEEVRMRMALRLYLDTWLSSRGEAGRPAPVREGRRMRWLERVLAPARKGRTPRQWRRLQAALALTAGADAVVVMKDVCRLEENEAREVLRWAAQALLRAGLEEQAPAAAKRRTPRAGDKQIASRQSEPAARRAGVTSLRR